jgi:putative transcriptional regulator
VPIRVSLDKILAERRMSLTELADRVGVTMANLSILKTGKARAVRFSTLILLCQTLNCQPGDLLHYEPGSEDEIEDQISDDQVSKDHKTETQTLSNQATSNKENAL